MLPSYFITMAARIVSFLQVHQYRILKICIGILFVWFGSLKLFPGISPAEELAYLTIDKLSFGLFSKMTILLALASLELILGIMLIFHSKFKFTFFLLLFHMLCTITPFFLLPDLTFDGSLLKLTLVGQYIVKNIVIISAAIVLIFNQNPLHSSNRTNFSV